jgi:hypothetical protein
MALLLKESISVGSRRVISLPGAFIEMPSLTGRGFREIILAKESNMRFLNIADGTYEAAKKLVSKPATKKRSGHLIALAAAAVLAVAAVALAVSIRHFGAQTALLYAGAGLITIVTLVLLAGFFVRVIALTLIGAAMGVTLATLYSAICWLFPTFSGHITTQIFLDNITMTAIGLGWVGLCAGCLIGGSWLGNPD